MPSAGADRNLEGSSVIGFEGLGFGVWGLGLGFRFWGYFEFESWGLEHGIQQISLLLRGLHRGVL